MVLNINAVVDMNGRDSRCFLLLCDFVRRRDVEIDEQLHQ